MNFHATLARPLEVSGVGLHTGATVRATLRPSEREGLFFARVDLPGAPEVAADWRCVAQTTHATTLRDGAASAMTVEHLLASLWAAGITHCRIELDAPEVPILDGSAQAWSAAIKDAGTRALPTPRATLQLREPVWIEEGRACVLGVPAPDFRLSVAVDFEVPHAGAQTFDALVTASTFATQIAPARTFTLESWLEPLRAAGLIRGGSLDCAVLIGDDGPSSPPRFDNELARHKALDVVGDLALLFGSAAFAGHIIATRAGHGAHRLWMRKCREQNALRPLHGTLSTPSSKSASP